MWKFIAPAALALACLAPVSALSQSATDTPVVIDINCVWTAMPVDLRKSLIAAAPSPESIVKALFADAAVTDSVAQRCGVPMTHAAGEQFGKVVVYKVFETWAVSQLVSQGSVDPRALARVWDGVPAASRAVFAADAAHGTGLLPDAQRDEVSAGAKTLGLNGSAETEMLGFYLISRSELETLSPPR